MQHLCETCLIVPNIHKIFGLSSLMFHWNRGIDIYIILKQFWFSTPTTPKSCKMFPLVFFGNSKRSIFGVCWTTPKIKVTWKPWHQKNALWSHPKGFKGFFWFFTYKGIRRQHITFKRNYLLGEVAWARKRSLTIPVVFIHNSDKKPMRITLENPSPEGFTWVLVLLWDSGINKNMSIH